MMEFALELVPEIKDGIGFIKLNRPQLKNAISRQMWKGIPKMMADLEKKGARVIVFHGEGGAFASGADLAELQTIKNINDATEMWTAIRDSLNVIANFALPTISMIQGPCMGGGCLLAIACDLRYADTGSMFSVPVARLGIVLDDDNLNRLADLIGTAFTKELVYTGAIISGAEAFECGLINAVFEPNELEEGVRQRALAISVNAPNSIREAKKSLARISKIDAQDQKIVIESYLSPEFKQRIARLS